MDTKLKKIIERIKELEKEVEAEEETKKEKKRVKQLTRKLIKIIRDYWEVREFLAEIVKLVSVIEKTHEKLWKTYLKLDNYISDLKLIEENEKIREIEEILEEVSASIDEILENLEREVLDNYRLIISDRKYVLATDGNGFLIGVNDQGELVFWTEGYSPNKYFKISENLSRWELEYLLATLEPVEY
ncbi:MAG: hypothetical protein QW197_03690 [Candidatus Aenigmatarchaeota archaeon]